MRLIDADALKELLIDTLESIKKNPKMDGQEAHIIAACHMLTEMIDDASTVSTARNGWISVKDRLPEPGRYVACIAKRNPFSRFMPMVARIEKNGWANPITEQYISEVTHWMPLPEPPEALIKEDVQ